MKKLYVIFAAIAMAGMVCACNNEDPANGGGSGKDKVSANFKVDGNFDEWKDADLASADLSEIDVTDYPSLTLMKAGADSKKVYFYFEYELVEGQTIAPIDILINSDGDASTGFTSWIWSSEGCGWDFMLESEAGFLANEGKAISDLSDIAVYKCIEGDGQDAWAAGSKFEQQNVDDFIECKGKVEGGVAYFEVAILRSVINANKKGSISFGVTMTDVNTNGRYEGEADGSWETAGILPQSEDGIGVADMLEVKLP